MISLQITSGVKYLSVFMLPVFFGCEDGLTYDEKGLVTGTAPARDTIQQVVFSDSISESPADSFDAHSLASPDTAKINTKSVTPDELVSFAETQLGVPYRYASIDPKVGFDCSGFITYVFSHFDIKVPRSSVDFTNIGQFVPVEAARKGDLILFTGTNSNIRTVGHMGIIYSVDDDEIKFIHSSSGKAMGVTITPLNEYYLRRFVSVRRIFPQNQL